MSNLIVIYASMSGNTEEMADAVVEGMKGEGVEPIVKNVMDARGEEIANYEGIALGAYTWGDGELPDEFLDFYEEMETLQLQGKKAIVFGSCDSAYSEYGAAVDTLTAKLKQLGAEVILEGLKVELRPSASDKEVCRNYGKQLAQRVAQS